MDKVMSLCFNVLSRFSELVIYIYLFIYMLLIHFAVSLKLTQL